MYYTYNKLETVKSCFEKIQNTLPVVVTKVVVNRNNPLAKTNTKSIVINALRVAKKLTSLLNRTKIESSQIYK